MAIQQSGLDPRHRRAGEDADAACGENAMKARLERRRKARQDFGSTGYQHERQPPASSPARDLAPQPALDREQKLDPAGAGADQRHTRAPLARAHARHEGAEPAEKAVDRLDRNGVLLAPGMSAVFGVEPILSDNRS